MINRRGVYIFVFGGFFIFGALVLMSGFRQGWFAPSVTYSAVFDTGEGVVVGTPVSISGLRAGSVKRVDLNSDNKVVVLIGVQKKFAERIREDSRAMLGRPFIIGERMISITPGSNTKNQLAQDSVIPGEESLEITDLLSGGRLSPYFDTFNKLMKQMQIVVEGDGTKNAITLLDVYRQANRSLVSIEGLAKDVRIMRTDVFASNETKQMLKELSASSSQLQGLMIEMQKTLPALTQFSGQMNAVIPEVTKTMKETVFTLQAMQRSFILSGGVRKLKDEQEEQDKKARLPASEGGAKPFAP